MRRSFADQTAYIVAGPPRKWGAASAACPAFGPLALFIALLVLTGCSISLPIASLKPQPEITGSVPTGGFSQIANLDIEDIRRAQSALSLAVDPQGPGLPVNWDNPASRRHGTFVQNGNVALTDSTICRPFISTLIEAGTPNPSAMQLQGEACRVGPGEWAVRSVARLGDQPAQAASDQPLPAFTAPMIPKRGAEF